MANRKTDSVDPLNTPVKLAAEMAFAQLNDFLGRLPNPPGQVRPGDAPARLTLAELQRMTRGA